MLTVTHQGLWCAAGGFHIDPSRRVDRALITHAHSDHARPGCRTYLCAAEGVEVLRLRVGREASVTGLGYGQRLDVNGVTVSFHPAGHVLGSSQIRLEHRGEVWVASGDYKRQIDPTCAAFEPVRCHTFVTESTFGLPIYRWPDPGKVFNEIHEWWRGNQEQDRTSLLFAYSLGKAQRLLAGLESDIGPIFVHDAIRQFLPAYAAAGVKFPPVESIQGMKLSALRGQALVIAPPGGAECAWLYALGGRVSTASASGWMLCRRARRQQAAERGFVLSDHVDWAGIVETIRETNAVRVLVTHGVALPLVRWLRENGWDAEALPARASYLAEDSKG